MTPGERLEFVARGYADPEVDALVAQLQAEYVVRYGGPDETEVDPAEFDPPGGLFLVVRRGGSAVSMGGWRAHAPGVVELKRMYVPAQYRRQGLARATLAELERRAALAGATAVVLNTGLEQPEAVAMYEAAGYQPTAGYGIYAGAPVALFFGKALPAPR